MPTPLPITATTDTFRTWYENLNEYGAFLNAGVVGDNTVAYGVFTIGANANTSLLVSNSLSVNVNTIVFRSNSVIGANLTINTSANAVTFAPGSLLIQPVNGTIVNSTLTVNSTTLLQGAAVVNAAMVVNGSFSSNGTVNFNGLTTVNAVILSRQTAYSGANSVCAPSALNDPQYDDIAFTGLADAQVLQVTPNVNTVFTGIQAPASLGTTGARILYIQNIGTTYKITLASANGSSAANNQFKTPADQSVDILPGGAIGLLWASTNKQWRVLAPLAVTQADLSLTGNLVVAGTLSVAGNTITNGNFLVANSTQTALGVDRANKRVGIGTNSPTTTLHVVGGNTILQNTTISGSFLSTSANATFTANCNFGNGTLNIDALTQLVTFGNNFSASAVTQSFIRNLLVQTLSSNGTSTFGNVSISGNSTFGNVAISGTFTAASLSASGTISGGGFSTGGTIFGGTSISTPSLSVTSLATMALSGSMTQPAARSNNVNYQAASDGFIFAYADGQTVAGTGYITIYSDTLSTPITPLQSDSYTNDRASVMIPVKRGNYYRVVNTVTSGSPNFTAYWVSLGTSG